MFLLPGVVGFGEMGVVGVGGATAESNELSVRSSDLVRIDSLPDNPGRTSRVLGGADTLDLAPPPAPPVATAAESWSFKSVSIFLIAFAR